MHIRFRYGLSEERSGRPVRCLSSWSGAVLIGANPIQRRLLLLCHGWPLGRACGPPKGMLVPAIHDFPLFQHRRSWMAGPSPNQVHTSRKQPHNRLPDGQGPSCIVMARLVRAICRSTRAWIDGPDKPGHDGMSHGRSGSFPRSVHAVGIRPAMTRETSLRRATIGASKTAFSWQARNAAAIGVASCGAA